MGFRNPDHDHVEVVKNKLSQNLDKISRETARRKNAGDVLNKATDAEIEKATAIIEGRMKY